VLSSAPAIRAQTPAPGPGHSAGTPSEPAGPGDAAPADADAASPDQTRKLEDAKELFRKGNELRSAGDYQGALDMYLASRRALPSIPNTLNAALTLDHLGRFDEALEMYEDLLTRFTHLDNRDRRGVANAMRVLRGKLGSLDVSSNVNGVLLVDGRQRGKLPLTSPVPVLPGRHVVRVLKDGYDAFEENISIKVRQKKLIDARLKRLLHVGKLRVDDPALAGADLFIDGGKVGTLPWEGTLAPGTHRYRVRKGDIGTAPRSAVVVEGQTVLVEVKAGPLSGDLRFAVDPPTAELYIDGVRVGHEQWQGRLPVGEVQVLAREYGYHPEQRTLHIEPNRGNTIALKLRVDSDSPRWGRPEPGKPWAEAFAGFGLFGSFGSDMEAGCNQGACSKQGIAHGPVAGLRGGWQFPFGVSVELGVGYLSLSKTLTRTLHDTYDGGNGDSVAVAYEYTDHIRFQGPLALVGAGYPIELSKRISLALRADVGVVFAGVRDVLDAEASALGKTVPAEVQNSGKTVRSAAVFVDPEARLVWKFGALHAGLGLGAFIFPVTGPRLETGDTRVVGTDSCDRNPPPPNQTRPVDCAKNTAKVAGERGYAPFVVFVPTLVAGYTF
jgi:hypothetical protein